MITLALNILSFIAIALLCVFILMITLCALIMLVPLRYECEGDIHGKSFSGQARLSWLFGLVAVVLDKDNQISLNLLGICVWRSVNNIESKQQESPAVQASEITREHKPAPETKHNKFIDNIKSVWHTFKSFKDYPDKDEIFNQAVLLTKRLIKTTLPQRLELSGSFGFEDPSNTGMATGAISALEPFLSPQIKLHAMPDFSQQILDLKLLIQGKISGISFVTPLCKFLFSKPVWRLVRKTLRMIRRRHVNG